MATHQRQRRVLDGFQTVEELPAALDQCPALGRRIELRNFRNIGAGDEARVLAGADDQPLGRIDVELVEQRRKLAQHLGRQGIGGFARLVQGSGGDALGIDFQPPAPRSEASLITVGAAERPVRTSTRCSIGRTVRRRRDVTDARNPAGFVACMLSSSRRAPRCRRFRCASAIRFHACGFAERSWHELMNDRYCIPFSSAMKCLRSMV